MNIDEHFKHVAEKVDEIYKIAKSARERGLDPIAKVEVPLAISL